MRFQLSRSSREQKLTVSTTRHRGLDNVVLSFAIPPTRPDINRALVHFCAFLEEKTQQPHDFYYYPADEKLFADITLGEDTSIAEGAAPRDYTLRQDGERLFTITPEDSANNPLLREYPRHVKKHL